MSERIAIIGASVRAAAASAVRAGYQVVAADLFADEDLRAIAETTQIDDYPTGFIEWVKALSPRPTAWLYTGALENQPELIDELKSIAPLWGNDGDVVRQVRSPWLRAEAIQDAGLLFPETSCDPSRAPPDGSWLLKTGRGASGSGVAVWRGQRAPANSFAQRRVPGVPCSATFVATGGNSRLLGVARQLVGEGWLRAREFQFCGAIAPRLVTKQARAGIQDIGSALAERFRLRGLFGVDLVIDVDQIWTIEVNPRFTSSAEVIEQATGVSALAAHAKSCNSRALPSGLPEGSQACFGKAILSARASLEIARPLESRQREGDDDARSFALADLPRIGARIERTHPIVTIFARGGSTDEVAACLKARVAIVEEQLYA